MIDITTLRIGQPLRVNLPGFNVDGETGTVANIIAKPGVDGVPAPHVDLILTSDQTENAFAMSFRVERLDYAQHKMYTDLTDEQLIELACLIIPHSMADGACVYREEYEMKVFIKNPSMVDVIFYQDGRVSPTIIGVWCHIPFSPFRFVDKCREFGVGYSEALT